MPALSVPVTPPFDFARSLAFLDSLTPCQGDNVCTRDRLITGGFVPAVDPDPAARFASVPFVATVRPSGETELSVEADFPEVAGETEGVAAWLSAHLSLVDDLGPLYAAAADDPPFGRVVDDLYGYHHVRFPTPFEAACWAALSQRTPMATARSLKRNLVDAVGRVETVDGAELALFPTPERVAADPDAVADALNHERKTRTVLAAAEAFTETDLAALDDDALVARLHDVWGFGDWSAEFVALRGFGRLDRVPRGERRLRAAVADLYGLDRDDGLATDADLDRLSDPYGPLAGYWAHYVRVWVFRRDGGRDGE